MIKTSVIIPVYNVEKYLDQCVESVLQQTQKDIEIILVNDGSTDGSGKIIQFYERNNPCVKAIYQDNHKLGAARNTGLLAAKGEYIYFLDSDDYIDAFLLDKCYMKARKNELDFLMFDSKILIEEKEIYNQFIMEERYDRRDLVKEDKIFSGKEFWKKYYEHGGVYTNAYLFYINRQFYIDNKLFFVPEIFYEDNDWVIRLFKSAKKVMYLSEQLYYRRVRNDSIMASKYTDVHIKSIIIVCKLHINLLRDSLDADEVLMVIPRYIVTLNRFLPIFRQFVNEQVIYKAQEEVVELYDEMIANVCYIWECNIQAGLSTLSTINLIRGAMSQLKNRGTEEIHECIKEIFGKLIVQIPLDKKVNIGIYGTGKRCKEFLQIYKWLYGKPIANLLFIDSIKKSEFKFNGYAGYNICDINTLQLDMILITSAIYGDQMEQSVQKNLTQCVPIIRLPDLIAELYTIISGYYNNIN